MIAALLILLAAPASDDALRSLELEDAAAKGKQEKGLEAINKLLKNPGAACPKPKPCPLCPDPTTEVVEVPIVVPPLPPPAPPPSFHERVPGWAWAVGGIVLGLATGILVTR